MSPEVKKVLSVAIAPELLARIDRVAEAREETRSTVADRILKNGIEDEERFLNEMAVPMFRKLVLAAIERPTLMAGFAKLIGERVDMKELEQMASNVPRVRAAGEKLQEQKRSKKSSKKSSA